MPERRPIRVLVVDDSAVMRKLLPAVLTRDPDIEVVATAVDGVVALRKLARFRPDVVTLDLEMPRMDGLDVLREMVNMNDTPVLVVSAHTQKGAAATVRALEMGAVDVVAKPADAVSGGIGALSEELLAKVHAVAGRRWRRPRGPRPLPPAPSKSPHHPFAQRVVAIAASTGGPAALSYILPRLPADLRAAVVVVQHMPEGFTAMLAERLNQSCDLEVTEARDGDVLRQGRVLVAPGGRHLRVKCTPDGAIALVEKGPLVSGHRPSADVLFHSAAAEFGMRATGVLLTGMGEDGASGLEAIRGSSGTTIAQDEESSVVFGMPRAAILRGVVDQVLSLERVPEVLVAEIARQIRSESRLAAAAAATILAYD